MAPVTARETAKLHRHFRLPPDLRTAGWVAVLTLGPPEQATASGASDLRDHLAGKDWTGRCSSL